MHESGEMYLETILILGQRKNLVRAVDVAAEMKLSKPSVSRALVKLKSDACIIVDENGHIAFTEKGRAIADMADETAWTKKALANIARAGFFSSDRTIEEYNREIWGLG